MSKWQTTACTRLELIPASQRTPALLQAMAETFSKQALLHEPAFEVSKEDIEKKLATAPRLVVAFAGSEHVAFLSATLPLFLPRTRLWGLYIPGVIVSPDLRGERIVARLLATLGLDADLLLLHTQNYIMAKAVWNGRAGQFPAKDGRRELREPLKEDLVEMLRSIGRNPAFEPLSGIVPYEYPKYLYSGPLPANQEHSSFERLTPECRDAVLCLAFNNQAALSSGFGSEGAL